MFCLFQQTPEDLLVTSKEKEMQSALPPTEPEQKPKERCDPVLPLEPSDSVSQTSFEFCNSITLKMARSAGLTAKIKRLKEIHSSEDEQIRIREAERIIAWKREIVLIHSEIEDDEIKEKLFRAFQEELELSISVGPKSKNYCNGDKSQNIKPLQRQTTWSI